MMQLCPSVGTIYKQAWSGAGTAEEMVCPGGEATFIKQMVQDSLQLQRRIHWYTTMVGKKATLKELRPLLHRHRVTALRTTEFVQVDMLSYGTTAVCNWCCSKFGKKATHKQLMPMLHVMPSMMP